MFEIKFSPQSQRELKKFPRLIQQRILKKLISNAKLSNPLVRAKSLTNLPPTTHRFRVGKYRISFYINQKTIFIEQIKIRGQAYQ
ncbi:type II toxin-antitoxin system RelE/ParE family toxin [Patescibacteria group bacterium]|nr:type II toxin-antitoxin system RelE/ParE family toxin [Patescibacteria group bacterium]